jgi:cell division protein FtsB
MASEQKSLASLLQSRGISGRVLVFVSVLFILAITLAPPMQRYFAQRAQINALRAQLHDAGAELEQAKRDLARWDDPAFVASQARTRLHFVFPGERQYIVLNTGKTDDQKGAPAAPVSNQIPTGLPWYGRLVASITSTNANP